MSKRLIRVFNPQLSESIPSLVGMEMNVVLLDGNTAFGRLESFSPDDIVLRDLRNHKHTMPLAAIEELIYDHKVE